MLAEKSPTSPTGLDIVIIEGGVRIARRGYPDTPEARTWVPLVDGVRVIDLDDHTIEVQHTAAGRA